MILPASPWRGGGDRRLVACLGLVLLAGCAWFQEPVSTRLDPGPASGRVPPSVAAAEDSGAAAVAGGDSLSSEESRRDTTLSARTGGTGDGSSPPAAEHTAPGPEADADSAAAIPADAVSGPDKWRLTGDNLVSTTGASGQVIQIERPVIVHDSLLIRARQGTYLIDARVGRMNGDVRFTDGDLTGRSDLASYDRIREFLDGSGNVHVENDSLILDADRGQYDRRAGQVHMFGRVSGRSANRTMRGDEASWDRNRSVMTIRGNARLADPSQDAWVTGDHVLYDVSRNVATVTESPQLTVRPESGGSMRITGRRLYLDSVGTARAGGDVEVHRGTVVGYADSAAFFREERLAILYEHPRVVESNGTMLGDTLMLHFDDEERLDHVNVIGNAVLRYTPSDSTRVGEVSVVQGDELVMHFAEGVAERVVATGNAKSSYSPPRSDDPAATGSNVAHGDSITIFLEDSRIDRVVVAGNARGVYRFGAGRAAGTDSLDAPVFPGDRPRGAADGGVAADTLGVVDSPAAIDSVASTPGDTTTVGVSPDTTAVDSTSVRVPLEDSAAPAGREKVEYRADQVTFLLDERTVDLEGSTQVDYGSLTLKADEVRFFADKRYLEASGNPKLEDRSSGGPSNIVGDRMNYNLKTREGVIDDGWTKADVGYLYADRLRQVEDNDFLARHGSSTTCDAIEDGKDPHFHFSSKRMRIYLKDKVVAKPVTLYIRDIPVLALPFYVFSIRKGRHSGFLTPDFDFGFGGSQGRFFDNLGYYWATNDYMDFTFSMGYRETPSRFVGRIDTRYAKRYLMNGNASFNQTIGEDKTLRDINAAHTMDLGSWKITGRAEFRDEGFREEEPVGSNYGQRLDRILVSDLSARRSFDWGGSTSLSFSRRKDLGAVPDDNFDQQLLRETLPAYSFSIGARPLGSKPDADGTGGRLPFLASTRWSFSSSGSTQRIQTERTTITTVPADSAGTITSLFSPEDIFQEDGAAQAETTFAVDDSRTSSARHRVTLKDTRSLLGALNVEPSFSTTENWVDREFSVDGTDKGFRRAMTWDSSFRLGTTAYGTLPGLGPLKTIRHTVEPNASINYQPEFAGLTYVDTSGVRRNRFPGVGASERKFLNLSLQNRFQAKVAGEDGLRRVNLFNWGLSTSYDFLAEERGWSNISSIVDLNRVLGVNIGLQSEHDPYHALRLEGFSTRASFALRGTLPGSDAGTTAGGARETEEERSSLNRQGGDSYDRGRDVGSRPGANQTLGWNANFNVSFQGNRFDDVIKPTARLTSSMNLQLTQNWSIGYNNVWSIDEKEIVGEGFTLRRDLHCWEASFSGNRVTDDISFHFRINVKEIREIKYEQGRSGLDNLGGLTSFLP